MGIVAVAGGTGDVGRCIVEGILKAGNHRVYILSRKSQESNSRAEIVAVDYKSVDSISVLLQRLNIDTVISTLNLEWEGAAEAQVNLIKGSHESGIVTRFIPSEFNIDYHSPEDKMPYAIRAEFLRAEEELKLHTELTYTLVRVGLFLDYLGLPYMPTNLQTQLYCLVDLPNKMIVIPGDGEHHVVFTHTSDVGDAVAALLDVEAANWPRESAVVGTRLTLTEMIRTVEEKIGQKFQVYHDDLDSLRQGQLTELPSSKSCYHYFSGGKTEHDSIVSAQLVGMGSGVFDISGTDIRTVAAFVPKRTMDNFLDECVQIMSQR